MGVRKISDLKMFASVNGMLECIRYALLLVLELQKLYSLL